MDIAFYLVPAALLLIGIGIIWAFADEKYGLAFGWGAAFVLFFAWFLLFRSGNENITSFVVSELRLDVRGDEDSIRWEVAGAIAVAFAAAAFHFFRSILHHESEPRHESGQGSPGPKRVGTRSFHRDAAQRAARRRDRRPSWGPAGERDQPPEPDPVDARAWQADAPYDAETARHAAVLGLTLKETRDSEAIKKAFRRKMQEHHPDRAPDAASKEAAGRKAQEINAAYAYFKDAK